jgi:hypothetical protein
VALSAGVATILAVLAVWDRTRIVRSGGERNGPAVQVTTRRTNGGLGEASAIANAGAHGQVAIRLARLLVGRGDDVIGLIRNPRQAEDLRAMGVIPQIWISSARRSTESRRRLAEVTPLSSQPARDQVAARRETLRWIATVRSSCPMRQPPTHRLT